MAPPAWAGESLSSIAFSANPRDSRVVSIYDKYLYDPKDLESSDPRRRELARKASQLKLHGRPANDMDANGLRNAGPSNSRPAQRKSVTYSQNTKNTDGHTASSQRSAHAAAAPERQDQRDRDSGAFGLGLGMLGGSDSEFSSDSDDDSPALRKNTAAKGGKIAKDSGRPESWTDRAVAVGHRPPDNASQNPPSLKLMALKAGKQSSDLSANSSDDRQNRLAADKGFVDRTSRHGSTIGFSGPPIDRTSPSRPVEPSSHDPKRQSARMALTKQLGLASPNLEASGPPNARNPSPAQQPPSQGFNAGASNNQARSMPRAAGPPSIDVNRAQQHGFRASPYDARPMQSPMGSQNGPPTPNSATPLRSPGSGSAGMPSPSYPAGQGPIPPNVLQRGPPAPYAQRGGPGGPGVPGPNGNKPMYNNGAGRPGPVPGPAGGPRPGQPPSSMQPGNGPRTSPPTAQRNLGPQPPNGPQSRGPPGPNGGFGPSFSDAPGSSNKRQSIFRRSMAMFGGGGPPAGPSGANRPVLNNQLRAQPVKRQSLFRRSMAMLTGGNGANGANAQRGPPPPHQGAQQMRMPVPNVPRGPQAPRVQGMQDDFEKPDHARKSQFLGAGGEGAEWDTFGEGAKFWRRFSMAQKTAGTEKLEEGSRAWMATMAKGRRKLIVMGAIAITILIGIIVGVIVWREIVSPSGSSSNEPSSVYKANLGTNSTMASSTTTTRAKSTATGTATYMSNYYSRALSAEDVAKDAVKRHLGNAVGGTRMRKRHFGHPIVADGSLADIN